jgi:PAS domain S-box-containing protein
MLEFLQIFFDKNFIPYEHSYLWKPSLVGLKVASDVIITLSYFSILLLLSYVLRQYPNISFRRIFWLFCAFIIAGSITHLMALWTLWHSDFWLLSLLKTITAGVSLYTARKLAHLIPEALALSSHLIGLETTNQAPAQQIEKHQQTHSERRESSQRLSLLIQQTPLAVIEWTLNFEVVDWNPAAERIFGYSKTEALGRHAVELIVPDTTKEQVKQLGQQLLRQQVGISSINENFTKDGHKIYCEWYNTPLIDSQGEVIGITTLGQNITKRKFAEEALQQAKNQLEIQVEARTQELQQALAQLKEVITHLQSEIEQRQQVEAALREREQQYRSVVDNVKEVIFQTDANGFWTFLNPAWSKITGFAIAQTLGTHFLDYVHPNDRQYNLQQFQSLIEGKTEYCRHEVRYLTVSNTYRWIEVFAQITFDAEGTIIGTCGTLYDITERHLGEAALFKRERYLEALVEVQRRLLAFKQDNQQGLLDQTPYIEILELLGQVSGASRVYVFENHRDAKGSLLMSQRAEWCALGINKGIDNSTLQNLYYEDFFPRWAQVLSQDEIIAGAVAEFPESERIVLGLQGILAILILPLKVNGQFFGFIGFDNCTETRPWDASEIGLLRIAAAALSLWYESFLAHEARYRSESRLRKQHKALSELARCPSIYNGNLSVALQEITTTVTRTLEAERCSVWFYNDDRSLIHCVDLYEHSLHQHSAGYQLKVEDYPIYFNTLEAERVIAAADAHKDSRTQEFLDCYLRPLGITSMLDVPIRVGGITVGVLCTEHTGLQRQWALEEQNFLSTIAYMTSLAMEASQRAAAQKALRESEERFRSLVAHIPGVVYRCKCDANRTMEFISDAIEEIFGYPAADFLHNQVRTFASLIVPQDLVRVKQVVSECLAQRQPYLLEYRIIRADGRVRWVYEKGRGVFSAQDNLLWLDGVLFDITEYRQTQEELRHSEEQFRQLTENIHEVFFLAAPDLSRMFYVSRVYEEVWGRTTKSLYEQPSSWIGSVHPQDRDRVASAFARQLQGEQDIDEEYRIMRPNGSVRWVWVRAFFIFNEAGVATRLAGIAEDITARKQAEAEILNALAKEKELSDLKTRFISITSHEFRTPLTTIMSTTELLEYYQWTKEEEIEQLHLIQDAVKQMLQLLEDLLFIGTADAGQLLFNPEPLDLRKFCQDLVAELQRGVSLKPSPMGSQHRFIFVSPDQTLLACMDKKLLRQLLSNLLVNAIKYSPSGGTIEFELACQGDKAIFQIQDQGIGIDKEDLPRLFEFFHRGKNVGAIAGTGLGLAIVKKCVDLHRGQITVNSAVGVGTQFIVTLPLKNHFSLASFAQQSTNRHLM